MQEWTRLLGHTVRSPPYLIIYLAFFDAFNTDAKFMSFENGFLIRILHSDLQCYQIFNSFTHKNWAHLI